MQTKLPVNETFQHPDLAVALRNDNGTFFCQQGGATFLVIAAEGYSIKSLRPIGRRIVEAALAGASLNPEPWTITKLSNQELETFDESVLNKAQPLQAIRPNERPK
jgi:hypothetical protein